MMSTHRRMVLLVLVSLALLPACKSKSKVSSDEAVSYHNFLVEQFNRIIASDKDFRESLPEIGQVDESAKGKVAKSYRAYRRTITDVVNVVEDRKRPGDASSDKLYQAFRSCIDGMEKGLIQHKKAMDLLLGGEGLPVEKLQEITKLFEAGTQATDAGVKAFLDEKKRYADQHGLVDK